MATGALLALRRGRAWAAGLGLIFAANPLARLVTALSGHGDEMLVVRTWAGAQAGAGWVNVAGAGVVAVLCTLALGVAWRALAGTARRPRLFLLALMAGIAITGTLLPLLNRLLAAGVLAEPLAGEPWLVHLATLASAVGVVLGMRWLARPLRT